MLKVESDCIVLSTGKRVYASCAIVGLCLGKGEDYFKVFEGYDGQVNWPMPDWWDEETKQECGKSYLTDAEMKELATFMSDEWKKLADSL